MVIGVCTLHLNIPMSFSLKDKRQVVKSVTARLRREFNISVAEVGGQTVWNEAVIAAVTVSSSRDYAHGLLLRVAQWVEQNRLDCDLVDFYIEFV
jgi:uncharacterized protein YlxP (DUF503 family)